MAFVVYEGKDTYSLLHASSAFQPRFIPAFFSAVSVPGLSQIDNIHIAIDEKWKLVNLESTGTNPAVMRRGGWSKNKLANKKSSLKRA